MHRLTWTRAFAGGALWAVGYNVTWGLAWQVVMRREWQAAAVAIQQPLPWTAEVWFVWGIGTVAIGIAVMAYVARGSPVRRNIVPAALTVWLLLSVGMAVTALPQGFTIRVVVMDAAANLIAIATASFIGLSVVAPRRRRSISTAPDP